MGRYDNLTFNSGEYIPQYAGLPLDEIQKSADTLAGRHYQNLASLNQLQLLREQYKSKMLTGAQSYVDEQFGDIDLALQDIAKNGGENATAKVAALTNRFLGDQGVLKGLQRAEEVQKEIELENNLIAQGKQPLRKKGQREALMQASMIDPETKKLNRLYETPYMSTVTPYENPVPHMEEIWKTINPDSIEGAIKGAKDSDIRSLLGASMAEGMPDIPLFFESLTKAGITDTKITDNLKNAWSSYQQTPAYKQAIEYAENPEAEKKRQADQFYKHGLLRVYNNISRQYMNNSIADDLLRGKGKPEQGQLATYAPGQAVNTLFKYNTEGRTPVSERQDHEDIIQYTERVKGEQAKSEKEYDPQYVSDYKTMLEIEGGKSDVTPDSKEAKAAALKYRKLVEQRVSNPVIQPISHDEAVDLNDDIQRQYSLYEYMDEATGEVFHPRDSNGKMTDKFISVTGGDPKKFKIESVYSPKNHANLNPGGNEKFVAPIAVVSEDADGKPKRFLVGQLPGQTSQVAVNTNKIYTTVNSRPGQWQTVHPRVTARELHGAQLSIFSDEDRNSPTFNMPIEAKIDGETLYFDNPERLAQHLLSKGIALQIK